MKKVMKKLCVCTLSAVIGMLSIQIMPVSAASKTGMGKITNKINKAGYNLWGGYDSPEEAATYDIDFYDSVPSSVMIFNRTVASPMDFPVILAVF